MKKLKMFFALMLTILIFVQPSLAYASEDNVTVMAEEMRVRELSEAEIEALSSLSVDNIGSNINLPMSTAESYTAYEYSRAFNIYLDDTWVARADAVCIVWHYTDGKVHLYQRTITVRRLSTYDADRFYGRIVNTDGSLSYTTGDRVRIIDYMDYWDFAIDFRVTPTEASFDCYEV
ncbi:MAG: hypothetical protein E7268_02735 [Lachnospiraceae bacterium]|nr:hypothetical protein [Lachnospiraceae bacterium]